jgi:Predicted Fe-S oxidoreductase
MHFIRITRDSGIPLTGCVYFGIIDRGTNLLQVRPSCHCNLACPFCSVDAGLASRTRVSHYEVDAEYLLSGVREIAAFKGEGVECHIDSPGEPLLYPSLIPLISEMRKIPEVRIISLQTNGTLLTPAVIEALEQAGLDRMNLSLHALDPTLARALSGVPWYEVDQIRNSAQRVARSRIDLLIAPVFLPGLNDAEIPRLIAFAREIGAGKRWPSLGIQKFERYRFGRCPKGIRPQTWNQFWDSLEGWERTSDVRLRLTPNDFDIVPRTILPRVFRKGERVTVDLRAPGWLAGEVLGVGRERIVSVMNCHRSKGTLRVRMISVKHNIHVAVPV